MQRSLVTSKKGGFTIIELLLTLPIILIILATFISALIAGLRAATISKAQVELSGDAQSALSMIERDIRLSKSFETQLVYAKFTDNYGPNSVDNVWNGSWTFKGNNPTDPNTNRVIILRGYATINNQYSLTRKLAYVNGSLANDYDDIPNGGNTLLDCNLPSAGKLYLNPILPYYTIYFVRDSVLYRRILTDTQTSLCAATSPQVQKQSCPREDAVPAAYCKAYDEIIARNVAKLSVTYYRQIEAPTPQFENVDAYNSTNPLILSESDNAVIYLTLGKTVSSTPVSATLSVRVGRIN